MLPAGNGTNTPGFLRNTQVNPMNMSRTILVGVALAATALMLLPSAAAQVANSVEITKVTPPSGPVKPQIETPQVSVTFVYHLQNQAQQIGGGAVANLPVTLTPQCQNGVILSGSTQVLLPLTPTQASTANIPGTATFQVSIPRTAPGLQNIPCTLKAKGETVNQAYPATAEANYPFQVTADYYSLNQVKLATKLKQSGPQKQVPFELEITNFGNARTQYSFEIASSPTKGKWNALLPEVLLLDSPNSGQGSPTNTAVFTVATPFKNGWNNEEGAYSLNIKPAAADDPSKVGNPLTANMLVRVRGVYVPGLEPAIMLGALLGSALILRLRKDE